MSMQMKERVECCCDAEGSPQSTIRWCCNFSLQGLLGKQFERVMTSMKETV